MILPGITAITWLYADSLYEDAQYEPLIGMEVRVERIGGYIPLAGLDDSRRMEVVTDNAGNGSSQKATLTFASEMCLPEHRPLAFIVRDANGRDWLLGQPYPPYLSVVSTVQTGTPGGDSAVYLYTVKETAPVCLRPCRCTVEGYPAGNGTAVGWGTGTGGFPSGEGTGTGTASFTEATEQDIDDMITAITEPSNESTNESASE